MSLTYFDQYVLKMYDNICLLSLFQVFSLFLDALIDLIQLQSRDLNDWLYVLLSRLINKLGGDMLGSIHAKVQRTLDVVRYIRRAICFIFSFISKVVFCLSCELLIAFKVDIILL